MSAVAASPTFSAAPLPPIVPAHRGSHHLTGDKLAVEICRRLSCETGWPIRFVADASDTASFHAPTHDRLRPLWQCDLRDGHHRSGWIRIDQPTGRPRDTSFLRACELVSAVVPTLSVVLAEPCSTDSMLGEDDFTSEQPETLTQTITQVLENLLKLTGLRSAGFFLRSADGCGLILRTEMHRDGQVIPHARRSLETSPFDLLALKGQRSLVRREESDLPADLWQPGDEWLPDSCQLGMCEPVMAAHAPGDGSGVLGTLWVFDRRARRLARREVEIVASVAARLGQILERAVFVKESADRQRLTNDLLAASENTPDDLSETILAGGRIEVATRCHAHSSVGGDLCEVLVYGDEGEEQAVLALGDASGHSLPATMVMATVRGALRALSLDETLRIESDAIMNRLNKALVGVAQSHQFMTMVTGHIDAAAGHLTFTNAGHPPPVLIRRDDAGEPVVELPGSHGMLLGVFEDADYERLTVDLRPGDVMVVYTDGLAEAAGPDRCMFKTDGVAASTLAHLGKSAAEIRDEIWADVESHLAGIPCDDDRSLMVLKVN